MTDIPNQTNTNHRILELISDHLGIPVDELTPDADFQEDLNTHKLELTELLQVIENEFKIMIPEERIPEIQTIDDLITLVNENLP